MNPEEVYRRLKIIMDARESLAWKEGELLYTLKKKDAYQKVFGSCDSWRSFLAEVNIPENTAYYKYRLYEKWILELGFSHKYLEGIHTRKLSRAIPYIENKTQAMEVVEQAKHLSFSDFLIWLKERFPKDPIETKKETFAS